jgi:hypothetical protein
MGIAKVWILFSAVFCVGGKSCFCQTFESINGEVRDVTAAVAERLSVSN